MVAVGPLLKAEIACGAIIWSTLILLHVAAPAGSLRLP